MLRNIPQFICPCVLAAAGTVDMRSALERRRTSKLDFRKELTQGYATSCNPLICYPPNPNHQVSLEEAENIALKEGCATRDQVTFGDAQQCIWEGPRGEEDCYVVPVYRIPYTVDNAVDLPNLVFLVDLRNGDIIDGPDHVDTLCYRRQF